MNLQLQLIVLAVAIVCSRTASGGPESANQPNETPDVPEFSIPLQIDAGGQPLDGNSRRYTFTFAADALPPAKAWSLMMYELPQQNFVANPLDRHAIDSAMLPGLLRNADGSVTIEIQKKSPGRKRQVNWLPAPDGPFLLQLKLFEPEQAVLDGAWEAPTVERVD